MTGNQASRMTTNSSNLILPRIETALDSNPARPACCDASILWGSDKPGVPRLVRAPPMPGVSLNDRAGYAPTCVPGRVCLVVVLAGMDD